MTRKFDPEMTCRGRWSVCDGKNPSRSAAWHICQECTDKRTGAMRAAADPTPGTREGTPQMTDKAISKALEAQRRAAVRYAPLASDRR